jgi:hypothetical protein
MADEYSVTHLPTSGPSFELQTTDLLKEVADTAPDRDIFLVLGLSADGVYDWHVRIRPTSELCVGDVLQAMDEAREQFIRDFA